MPAKVKVRILAGRNLPVMDKSSDASDAFVEVKLGNTTYKTEVYRRSLNPFWNSEWFRFEVSDQELQDEPLQIRIMDYDTYSANDAIGKVYINLNPLLLNPGRSMNGWLPIYDTLHGIRGEINCMVKVNLFADNNRFRHSSCGVRFFFSDIPNGYKCDAILGFVDELLVNDDPEYQWIDKIRTPRASNEARQTLFTKLSGEVQRKLGLKAEIFGGNAVIGYQQSFDLEGGSGIVGRGIGTAVVLSKVGHDMQTIHDDLQKLSMSLSNSNNPYVIPGGANHHRAQSSSQLHNHSLNQTQSQHTDWPLVHSVSADYFYEVPTNAIKKLNKTKLSSRNARSSSLVDDQGDAYDVDTLIERLKSETDVIGLDSDDDTDVDSDYLDSMASQQAVASGGKCSPVQKSAASLLFKRAALRKSIGVRPIRITAKLNPLAKRDRQQQHEDDHDDHFVSLKFFKLPKASAYPIKQSASKLIQQLLSHRRNSTGTKAADRRVNTTSRSMTSEQPITATRSIALLADQQKRSTSSESSAAKATTTASSSAIPITGQSGSVKRRKEKGGQSLVSTSPPDDALSIIEEKLDDDAQENQQQLLMLRPEAESRSRLSSASSSTRLRHQMTRSKEIDLGGGESSAQREVEFVPSSPGPMATNSKVSSLSASTDEFLEGEDGAKNPLSRSGSLLSSSSPSSSLLTDETIKANKEASLSPKMALLSTTAPAPRAAGKAAPSLHRSDTDLAHSQIVQKSSGKSSAATNNEDAAAHLNRSESAYGYSRGARGMSHSTSGDQIRRSNEATSPDPRKMMMMMGSGNMNVKRGDNFAQSVGVIKAQQHLLQNMIKHHNQNLVINSMNKAKNALIYPGRIQQSEYPFVTLKRYPDGLIQCTGGVVSVHSVKLLDHIINDEESETRDSWWTEIRKEIRSHAKSLNCNTILGYTETSKVLGDVCILSARGTAAVMKPLEHLMLASTSTFGSTRERAGSVGYQNQGALKVPRLTGSPPPHSSMPPVSQQSPPPTDNVFSTKTQQQQKPMNTRNDGNSIDCSLCHTPLHCVESLSSLSNCSICGQSKVPDVLLLTIEPPKNLNIVSKCTLIQARVCRAKRDSHGEASAKEIGDALPFLEYELHRQLFSKLKFRGMNCLFNLNIDISVGENFLTGLATGTGCFILGLPTPEAPRISAGKGIKTTKLDEIQRLISLSAAKNRANLGLDNITLQLAEYHRRIGIDLSPTPHVDAGNVGETSDRRSITPRPDAAGQQLQARTSEKQVSADSVDAGPSTSGLFATSNTTSAQDSLALSESMSEGHSSVNRGPKSELTDGSHKNHHHRHHHNHHHHHHHNSGHHHHHRHRKSGNRSQASMVAAQPAAATAPPTENLINMLKDENNIVLEVDDNDDADIIALLIDNDVQDGYMICNSEIVPTISPDSIGSINMFTQVTRVKLNSIDQFAQQFDTILQTLYVKLRRSLPCCLTNLNFVVDLPESYIVQITLTGCLLGLRTPTSELESLQTNDNGQGAGQSGSKDRKQNKKAISSSSMSPTSSSSSSQATKTSASSSSSSTSTSSSSSSESSSAKAKSSSSSSNSGTSSSSSSSSTLSLNAGVTGGEGATSSKATPSETGAKLSGSKSSSGLLKKQSSRSNIAALINAGKSTLTGGDKKSKTAAGGGGEDKLAAEATTAIEMLDRSSGTTQEDTSTRATIAAVKQEIVHNKLGGQMPAERTRYSSTRKFRAVFKKQQTFPGASSPAISGQDNVLNNQLNDYDMTAALNSGNGNASTGGASGGSGATAARNKATALLNKVKQPFKDLGSNFNTTTSQYQQSAADGTQQLSVVPTRSSFCDQQQQQQQQPGNNESLGERMTSIKSTKSSKRAKDSDPSTSAAMEMVELGDTSTNAASNLPLGHHHRHHHHHTRQQQQQQQQHQAQQQSTSFEPTRTGSNSKSSGSSLNSSIDITSLSYIPGAKEYHYLGNLSLSFVRETNSVRENGGLNGFIHCFLMEVYAIVRAHVSALGGNAFLSFRLQQSCIFYHSNKNQAQCLISVAGDAVQVTL